MTLRFAFLLWSRFALACAALSASTAAGAAADRITLGLSWLPQAEYGGFYQAATDGTYARHGLEVVIKPGGAQINPGQLLAAGSYDLVLGNSSIALNAIEQKLDFVAVAAFFQKEPTILIAHDDPRISTIADLKGRPAAVSGPALVTYWPLLKRRFGFTDTQIRPYPFSLAPFIANAEAIQQGFATTDEPQLERKGVKVKTFLLADHGYAPYGDLVVTTRKFARERADALRRFVAASSEGWRHFLSGDATKAKAAILAANPDYSGELFDDARKIILERNFVDGGDAGAAGIGAMTDERWKSFFQTSVENGVYPPTLDYAKAYTLEFVRPENLTK